MASRSKKRTSSTARTRNKRADAIALLKADHRQVEAWFSPFSKSKNQQKKRQLATQICDALTVHTTIEEEIQGMSPTDDYFDAKVTVLSEMIKHHVKEEEQPGGMFSEAKKSAMDLRALGEQLAARKEELQAAAKAA